MIRLWHALKLYFHEEVRTNRTKKLVLTSIPSEKEGKKENNQSVFASNSERIRT